jgi:hypothetical protein
MRVAKGVHSLRESFRHSAIQSSVAMIYECGLELRCRPDSTVCEMGDVASDHVEGDAKD